jgi:hypothetical protein
VADAPSAAAPASIRCAASLSLGRTQFTVGRRAVLAVRVRDGNGAPLAGVTVRAHGAGVRVAGVTGSSGRARLVLRPGSAGVIRITLGQGAGCASVSRLVRAKGAFKPPKPNFTG